MKYKSSNLYSKTSYGKMSRFYEWCDWLNYNHAAKRSRNCFIEELPFAPVHPLIIACGDGDFAVSYTQAENPSQITLNDLSGNMLDYAKTRVETSDWKGSVHLLPGDITKRPAKPEFDFVTADYLLSMFSPNPRVILLQSILRFLAPGGILQIADYARPKNPLFLPLFYINWVLSVLFFWIVTST